MTSIETLFRYYMNSTIKDNLHDEEMDSWYLMENIRPIIGILIVYLVFVLKLGPRIMKNKEAITMKKPLLIYNLAIFLYNAYMCTMFLSVFAYQWKHLWVPHTEISIPSTNTIRRAQWFYFMAKLIELFDTVFFVIRKKQSQVSLLHVYHHSNMFLNTWLFVKYFRNEWGISVVVGTLNCFVHILTYSYYFLAALGPKIQKYLWWKKYITIVQLTQFAVIIVYLMTLVTNHSGVFLQLPFYMAVNTVTFVLPFLNFYRKEYVLLKEIKMHQKRN